MMNPELDHRIDPAQYVRMIWRRKWIVALCAVTVICGTLIGLQFVPDVYVSEATLMIDDRQRLAGELRGLISGVGTESGGRLADRKRQDELESRVRSRPFLERVVRLLRIHEDPQVQERAANSLSRVSDVTLEEAAVRVAVSDLREKISFASNGMSIYRIRVRDTSPTNAQTLLKWISELYVDTSAQSALEDLNLAREFGAEQLKIYEQQLAEAESELEAYKQLLIEQDLSQGAVTADNVNVAESLYRKIMDEAELARVRTLPYQTALTGSELSDVRNVIFDDSRVRNQARGIVSALTEEARNRLLSSSAVTEWPPTGSYVTLRRGLLQLIERTVDNRFPDASSTSRDALARFVFTSLDRDAHAETAEFLGQEIAQFRRRVTLGPRGEMELARLQAQVQTKQELLQSFQAQLVASDVSQAVAARDMGMKIEIISPAQVPLRPTEPNRPKILLASILMGPFFGIILAIAFEVTDPTLRSLGDFQRAFRGPIIGTAPLIARIDRPRSAARAYLLPSAVGLVLILTVVFFMTKDTLFANLASVDRPVVLVDPEAGGAK